MAPGRRLVAPTGGTGKDFSAGLICTTFFVAPQVYFEPEYVRGVERRRNVVNGVAEPDYITHQRRIVTTSVKDEHLDILWGEISRCLQTCSVDLSSHLSVVHHEIRFKEEADKDGKNVMSYLRGATSKTGEGMSGHHAPYTLGVGDEASGLDDEVFNQFSRWAKRELYFGNPNPTNNKFKTEYQLGDLLVESGDRRAAA